MNDREDRCLELFQKKGNERKCERSTIPMVLVGSSEQGRWRQKIGYLEGTLSRRVSCHWEKEMPAQRGGGHTPKTEARTTGHDKKSAREFIP